MMDFYLTACLRFYRYYNYLSWIEISFTLRNFFGQNGTYINWVLEWNWRHSTTVGDSFAFLFCFKVEKSAFFVSFLDIIVGLNPLYLNKKIQKMSRYVLGKDLYVFQQNSNIFLKIPMIMLKIDIIWNLLLDMQPFNYCLNQFFPWIFFSPK